MPRKSATGRQAAASSSIGGPPVSTMPTQNVYTSACAVPAISQRRGGRRRLARREVSERQQIGLGCQAEHRHGRSSRKRTGSPRARPRHRQDRRDRAPHHHGCARGSRRRRRLERIDTLTYVDEPERRLRFADREHPLDREPLEDGPSSAANGGSGLGEDVVREAVAGMRQRSVALGSAPTSPPVLMPMRPVPPCTPDCWAETPTHAATGRDEFGVRGDPVGCGVEAAADVEPLDPHRAVEPRAIGRAMHEQSRVVRRLLDHDQAVVGQGVGARPRRPSTRLRRSRPHPGRTASWPTTARRPR